MPPTAHRPFLPTKALLHPSWLAALALLVVNDHAFKGSGLLPAWVTGKLSDLAGYFLFPMLLGALVRVRSRRGAAVCHALTTGVLFVTELSPALARFLAERFGLHTWPDPGDLVAVVSIVASWRFLVPAAAAGQSMAAAAGRALVFAGALASVATTRVADPVPDGGDGGGGGFAGGGGRGGGGGFGGDGGGGRAGGGGGGGFQPPQLAEMFLWNQTPGDVQVRVSSPRDGLAFDCNDALPGPEKILPADYFAVVRHVTVIRNGRISLDGFARVDSCNVLLIEAEEAQPQLAVWRAGAFTKVDIVNSPPAASGIHLVQVGGGRSLVPPSGLKLSFARPDLPAAKGTGACAAPAAGSEPDWSEPLPSLGPWTVSEVLRGGDGCDELSLQLAGMPERKFFVCAGPAGVPFAAGDAIRFKRPANGSLGVILESDDAILVVVKRGLGGEYGEVGAGCAPIRRACGVGRAATVTISTPVGKTEPLGTGAMAVLEDYAHTVTVFVSHASRTLVADKTCDADAAPGWESAYVWISRKETP